MTDQTTTLYRLFTHGGELLYVGITDDFPRRFTQHARSKAWWSEVRDIKLTVYSTRDEAAAAETRAIHTEYPAHNLLGARTRPIPMPLRWRCEACGTLIRDGEGYLYIDALRDGWLERGADLEVMYGRGAELIADGALTYLDYLWAWHPLLRWEPLHEACLLEPERMDFRYAVDRLRTAADVDRWSDLGDWFWRTDWERQVIEAGGAHFAGVGV